MGPSFEHDRTFSGALGGHLAGIYTDLSEVLRGFGWEVHRTFYDPNMTLAVIVTAAIAMAAIGWPASRRKKLIAEY